MDHKKVQIRAKNERQLKIKVHLCGEEILLQGEKDYVKNLN
jgi:hypothetical protein